MSMKIVGKCKGCGSAKREVKCDTCKKKNPRYHIAITDMKKGIDKGYEDYDFCSKRCFREFMLKKQKEVRNEKERHK